MGVSGPGMEAAEQPAAESLLDAFETIDPAERQKHEAVLNYWLSIRGNRELPPLRDLDPLEISDAAPFSALLELVGGGEDAVIRHLGEALKSGDDVERITEAPRPSLLASIARKLSIVAISRTALAFEDEFAVDGGVATRCWVTLLPLSSAGAWVDYVYAFVSFGAVSAKVVAEPVAEEPVEELPKVDESIIAAEEDVLELDDAVEPIDERVEAVEQESVVAEPPSAAPPAEGFAFDAGATSAFYATKAVNVKPTLPEMAPAKAAPPPVQAAEEPSAPIVEELAPEPAEQPAPAVAEETKSAAVPTPHNTVSNSEGTLQSKLTDVRAKADEARMAKLKANAALYEGLAAAYDFALDAESKPEEYLKLVEAQGLKIQLRAPMRPVVRLAFDGMCDDSTIAQLEAVLAWAIEQDLPRGTLAQRIEEEGGIGPILGGQKRAA
jgi:hypothetical protein